MQKELLTVAESIALVNRFFFRRRWVFITTIALGFGFGLMLNFAPKSYTTSFVAASKAIAPSVINKIVDYANSSLEQNQIEVLADRCGCDPALLDGLEEISIRSGSEFTEISEQLNWELTIRMTFSTPSDAPALQACIMNLFNSNQAVNKQASVYLQTRKDALQSVEAEIEELNHLQQSYQKIMNKEDLPLGVYANGSYNEMINLIKYEKELISELSFSEQPIVVLTDVVIPSRPTLGRFKAIFTGLLLGLVAGLAIAVFLELREMGIRAEHQEG